MYGFPGGKLEYYSITVHVKCFNDSCDNVLMHSYPSYNNTPRMDGTCPKCGKGYSRKVNHIEEDRIVHRVKDRVYE